MASMVLGGIAVATSSPSIGRTRATVVFLGDSNEVLSGTDIDLELLNRDYGYLVVNIARPGATIRYGDCTHPNSCPTYNYWQARVADTLAAVRPSAWVVDLGINDTVEPGAPTRRGYAHYGSKIDWLMHLLGSTRVLWTNLPCKIEPTNRRVGCNQVNDALAQAVARHRNLEVLDWASEADQHPGYLGAPNGIHLTPAGAQAWADLVSAHLDSRFTQP